MRLPPEGEAREHARFDQARQRMTAAYARAGQHAVSGFWTVLEGLVPEDERANIVALGS